MYVHFLPSTGISCNFCNRYHEQEKIVVMSGAGAKTPVCNRCLKDLADIVFEPQEIRNK